MLGLTVVVGFNDLAAVEQALAEHRDQIAGMIVEPIMMNAGIIPPADGYLASLKELLHRNGALLTFDEVKTGLTVGTAGATGYTGVSPDILCLAKAIGGGVAAAAVGGTAEVMAHVANGDYEMVGTFNGNPLAMAATRAMLLEVATPEGYERLHGLRDRAVQGLESVIAAHGLEAHVVAIGAKGCVVFSAPSRPRLPRVPPARRPVQPLALARPARRRRAPPAVGQDRAVAPVRPARRRGRGQAGGELRAPVRLPRPMTVLGSRERWLPGRRDRRRARERCAPGVPGTLARAGGWWLTT